MNINELKEILKKHSDWLKGIGGERANLQDADLQDADLRGANLQDADLQDANLQDANLQDANLRGANLWGANLWGANLRGANLWDANLRGADLWDANLQDADLRGADLRGANLQDANLRGADLRGANLRDANLRDANLRDANLRGANLRDANLWGANLWDADLRGADLQDANLRDANLQDANLQGADLQGADNLPKIHQSNLAILKQQKGKLRAFKYLNGSTSPYRNTEYTLGETYKSENYSDDERVLCEKGLNVATLDWCLRNTNCDLTKTYIEVEFDAKDIVAIPYNTDGKFRVKKFSVIREISKAELEEYLKPLYPKEGELSKK